MRIYFVLLSLLLIFSCTNQGSDIAVESENITEANEPELEMLQLHYYSCFYSPVVLSFSVADSTILFQRSGVSLLMLEPPEEDNVMNEIVEVFKPETFYFHLDPAEYSMIKDSIIPAFSITDYCDTIHANVIDGGGHQLIFAYSNDSLVEVEMANAVTKNQGLLISTLTDYSIKHAPDSLTLEYLLRLH